MAQPFNASDITRAISKADEDFSYRLTLTRLVDGISTYTLVMPNYARDFDDQDEAYQVVAEARNKMRADAILGLFSVPPEQPTIAGEREAIARIVYESFPIKDENPQTGLWGNVSWERVNDLETGNYDRARRCWETADAILARPSVRDGEDHSADVGNMVGRLREALQRLRDRAWFIIGVNDPAIAAADAALSASDGKEGVS